ncbi:8962_t:CDS:2 [Cetraspora pellucida]|uniref:8962_t:CDS:1 n=1 Tax=Cetraspora pellucida TaxID=1433469 RepID=A0A9N9IQC4_9GLOM|nr:8962_t:CDS:2 [Cetraspora pellucida]
MNIKSAVQQICITNVKYARHTLQLSVNLGLKKVEGLISKCKMLVSILLKEKKKKQLCETQLQIILRLKQPLDVIKDKVRKEVEMMRFFLSSEEEFELLKKLIVIISPFNEATEFLSKSKYPILGFITSMLEELAYQLKNFINLNDEVILVRDTILKNLIKQ